MVIVNKNGVAFGLLILLTFYLPITNVYAQSNVYSGIPELKITLSQIDESDSLIYTGIDAALFWDDDKDGIFTAVPNNRMVKRILTRSLMFTFNLGNSTEYKKGIRYRMAIRTLYYSVGSTPETILIADYNNGYEGFILLQESEFVPTYFASSNNEYIKHTANWENNRKAYNRQKESIGSNEKREYDVFWPGEKLKIEVETTEVVEKIKVRMDVGNEKYETELSEYEDSSVVTGGAIYKGSLWDKDMINKWGNYVPESAIVSIDIVGKEGEILESRKAELIFDNRQMYFRHHKTR